VGFQKRAIPSGPWPESAEQEPKYKSSLGFPKSETLYGYDFCRTRGIQNMHTEVDVVVVESPFSVAKAYSLGIPYVLATFGAKVTPNQLALLHDFASITVWFDDDPAGRTGERTLLAGLPVGKVRVVQPYPGRDLGDCSTREEVQTMLDSAVPGFMKLAQYEAEKVWKGMRTR